MQQLLVKEIQALLPQDVLNGLVQRDFKQAINNKGPTPVLFEKTMSTLKNALTNTTIIRVWGIVQVSVSRKYKSRCLRTLGGLKKKHPLVNASFLFVTTVF